MQFDVYTELLSSIRCLRRESLLHTRITKLYNSSSSDSKACPSFSEAR